MGTHPIFESDFDCLTEMVRATAGLRSVKALVEAKAVQNVYTNGITAVNMAPASDACQVCVATIENGCMTKDLAGCVHGGFTGLELGRDFVTTDDFMTAIDENIQKAMH